MIGVQLDNEYMHSSAPWEMTTGVSNEWIDAGDEGEAYILMLRGLALDCGLTPAFFTGVLERMGEGAFCTLYYAGDELLAANLLLQDDEVLLDKFFCMTAQGRAYNLYFLSWFTNVRWCVEHGLARYQSGQAAYANKLRLGSRLTRTTMYVRHRNPVLNGVLHWVAPLFAADPTLEKAA